MPNLFKQGTQHLSGVADAVVRNIEACKQLAKMTRTSLGPNGMNKMVINHLDKLFVTSDAATILKETDVVHPAAKMMVLAANQQDYECGDGANSVIVLAGELMAKAEALLRMGLHPADIVRGFVLAGDRAMEILPTLTCHTHGTFRTRIAVVPRAPHVSVCVAPPADDFLLASALSAACFSAICAKQYGVEAQLCRLIGEACAAVMPKDAKAFNVDNVRVCKVLGGTLHQSQVVQGVVVARPPHGTVHRLSPAHIAVFVESIDASSTDTKGTVALTSAQELLDYSLGEETLMAKTIEAIRATGCNCVVTGGKISELAMHFLDQAGVLAVTIPSKFELRRLARSVGATLNLNIHTPIQAADLGFCSSVALRDIGAQSCTVFEQGAASQQRSSIATIVLRGSTDNYLNDYERAIEDGVNVVRATCRDPRFVCGAGAAEMALSCQLAEYASTLTGLEQYAVKAYAEALEVFPRTLAQNSGLDETQILARLYAAHERGDGRVGVDVDGAGVGDVQGKGVVDHLQTKAHAIRMATDAAATILQVDQIIMAKAAGGPKPPKGQGHWDDRED